MNNEGNQPRRYLIATAVARYPKAPQWDRPGLIEAREQIIRLFTEDLGYQHISTLGLDPSRDQLTALLRTFCLNGARQPDDIVAVYIGGHGEVLDDTHEHLLLTADTDPADVADALPTAELARKMLLKTRVRRVLLMLDTCYSGHGGAELTAAAITTMTGDWGDDHGSGLAVITSSQPSEQAGAGAFPRLLRDAVRALPAAGYNPATLPLDSIVKAMNISASKPGYQTIGHSVTGLTGEVPPFLPNPRHDRRMTEVDLAIQHASEFEVQAERRDIELRTRLLVRAMGGSGARSAQGWWFAGRHTALLDITAWLHHPDPARPLQVVTGNPGSGKTAVLGLIATLTHPQRRATVPMHTLGLPAAAVPGPATVDVAIYAQGLTTDQVLAGIAAVVHTHASTPGELLEALSGRTAPLTVLIDALDEAADPDHLTRRLLRPLLDHAAGRIRLLVGTRDFLLERLGLRRADAVDLDADRYADLPALTTYAARGLLEASPNSPYRDGSARLLRAVADAVAAAAHPSFLVARITSATLAAQDQVADPQDAAWRRTLPRLPGEAMHRDLDTRLGESSTRVRDLLRPLAFAEGQGLPWEDIWAAVASRAAGTSYTDDDLLWLREHAGSYVVEATESGRSTYRLYHQALAEHLHVGVDTAAVHRAIADVLVARVPRTLEGRRDWTCAHPYTLRHVATHAARAGLIDELVTDADYLVHAEPDGLLLALHQTRTDDGALTAAVYRCSADLHRHLPATRRRQVLAADAARFRAAALQQDLSASLRWRPRWATGQQAVHALHTTFIGHTGWMQGVACASLNDRPVAVTARDDSIAIVWDIATGNEITTFTRHTSSVLAVACCILDDRPVAVTAGHDKTARVWDLATGDQIITFSRHTDWVAAVACIQLDGRPVAVTAGRDNTARVWDLKTGNEITTFTRHTDAVAATACTQLDGRPVAVTTDHDNTARVWDLKTGNEITTFTRHTNSVLAVACTELDGRPVAVTAGRDNTARVWDLKTGNEITTFTGHTYSVLAVACTQLDGHAVAVTAGLANTALVWRFSITPADRPSLPSHSAGIAALTSEVLEGLPVAVTTGHDNTARVWDLATGDQTAIFTGHTSSVLAVACTSLDGRPIAVTTSYDETARVWDLATGEQITTFTRHTGWVSAVACANLDARPVAITTSQDNTARVWDIATGNEITTFTRHTNSVEAVACTNLDGRPIAVTTGYDETARVWDLATGGEIATFTRHQHWVAAVACTRLSNHPVAVTASYDDTARVWDLATGNQITTFTRHTDSVLTVACTNLDGRPIAVTTGRDNTARVWDIATNAEMAIFDFRAISAAAIRSSGELMVAAGWDFIVFDRTARH
ncbi:WD40 repeat domain-containing protein [Amycolatopsis sp. NPDC004169]|uniref:WD40 repeat domain-containing protein n=1 Tax=Amycolatopsis sp. NPDC004169 TaxID=3154453 RepID=UPI0033B60F35